MKNLPILHTASGAHALNIGLANSFLSRLNGLMFRKPLASDRGLLITRCPSVHTAFMRAAIDVVYLNKAGFVTRCVAHLKPWRASVSTGKDAQAKPIPKAAHTLELAAGSIQQLNIQPGDRLEHTFFNPTPPIASAAVPSTQRGSAMIEFIVVGPVLMLMGMAILQYSTLFFAKNQINHATFMAARVGAMTNVSMDKIQEAYITALVPLYGGGLNTAELAASRARAAADVASYANIELLNPTQESFVDWNDAALQASVGGGRRVIPYGGQATKDPSVIGASSGQSIQDANLIKLRITHGYEPKVPFMRSIYTTYLKNLDPGTDPIKTQMINDGRIPVVSHITLQMLSDAIEPGKTVSSPGPGNDGTPTDPGDPPTAPRDPPKCVGISCVCNPATDPNGCRPSGCQQGDASCDPGCGTNFCCLLNQQQNASNPRNLPSIPNL